MEIFTAQVRLLSDGRSSAPGWSPMRGGVANRADTLVDVVMVVRQQLGCSREGQQGNGRQREDENGFLSAL